MNKRSKAGLAVFPALILGVLIYGIVTIGCGGANPPFAPFGSEVTILNPLEGINIPLNSLEPVTIQAIVLSEEEEPINKVRVFWTLTFAGQNSIVVDTNGDGVPDARAIQMVDPFACGPQRCELTPIAEWFAFGAFVDSPFDTLTDRRGVAFVILLVDGNVIIDPATLTASTDSGSVDTMEFSVNDDREVN